MMREARMVFKMHRSGRTKGTDSGVKAYQEAKAEEVYLDDIIVCSQTKEEHVQHVRQVLQALSDAKLYVKAAKSEFHKNLVTFLSQVITPNGISMCPERRKTISSFPAPTTMKQLQNFLGLANSYRPFVDRFAAIATPLNAMTTEAAESLAFAMSRTALQSIQQLKDALTSAPVLRHLDPKLDTMVETDALISALSGILSQKHDKGGTQLPTGPKRPKHQNRRMVSPC